LEFLLTADRAVVTLLSRDLLMIFSTSAAPTQNVHLDNRAVQQENPSR
jgi:hypothetical protein